ncbi:MAG: SDR family oxidoreductase [Marinospirillum sp.]|uniref:SDR family oxidoreductase n=1 Tax=Marinospirillum sp. TaxID=2183934 RepID=UPI001A0434BF|nr:SDR family oxidoreductase [Marinospirillum sp.]MBE0508766.1 SDR family oxidoreductase [Marinospirillum sp.]
MILVTGASGQLGQLVIQQLLTEVSQDQILAGVRDPSKAEQLVKLGISVRQVDYDQPATLNKAFEGVERLLLISSSAIGQRIDQHRNVIEAASKAGVQLLAYTSLLHADTSPLALAEEHRATEALLQVSGLNTLVLRNGWYTENYTGGLAAALAHGKLLGCAGEGRIASASRADYAAAAAKALTGELPQGSRTYELAGDTAYTLAELATEVSRQTGQNISYQNLSEADYCDALIQVGLPPAFAGLLADSDTGAAKGGLFDDSHQLSQLIGRPTTSLQAAVTEALNVVVQ